MRLAYAGLVAFRAALVLLAPTSYIHPDEHMQCGEIAAHVHLGLDASSLPWEFANKPHIARSFLSAELMCGIPLVWLASLVGGSRLLAIKLWMLVISLVMDYLAFRVFAGDWHLLLVRASSWANIVLTTKTFSNTLEALLVDLLLVLLVLPGKQKKRTAFAGGVLIGFGCFVRITFPAFACVLALKAVRREEDARRRTVFVLQAAVGFALACGLALALDCYLNDGHFVVAPWENIKYNAQVENLAKHGLHPRYMHVLVNFPLLFGPVGVAALLSFTTSPLLDFRLHALLVPLAVLSAFPHQEFRFLLPLQTLSVLLGGWAVLASKKRIALWVVFNLALCFLFGVAHQGGVVDFLASDVSCGRPVVVGEGVYTLPQYLRQCPSLPSINDKIVVMRPQRQVGEEAVLWHYPALLHFNGEAGGFVPLVAVEEEPSKQ